MPKTFDLPFCQNCPLLPPFARKKGIKNTARSDTTPTLPRPCGSGQARKFAQALQFTWPGCPLIYYGDELGLEGGEDPHNRAPMPWGREKESEMLEHTKMLRLG